MGCSTSSRVIAEQQSPKNQHHGKEVEGLNKKDASLGTVANKSQGWSVAEGGSEGNTERMPSANEEINELDIDIKGELAKKPVTLSSRNRQTSSDILEELRMQGIIKTPNTTSQNRKAGDTTLVTTERTLQKPPAKLEKLEIKRKKANNLTIEDTENKARDKQQQKEFLIDRPEPIISQESSTTGNEIHCSTSEVPKTSNSFQLLFPLNLGEGSWLENEEVDDKLKSCFQNFNMVESDMTYNTIYEAF